MAGARATPTTLVGAAGTVSLPPEGVSCATDLAGPWLAETGAGVVWTTGGNGEPAGAVDAGLLVVVGLA